MNQLLKEINRISHFVE
jgi:hypothetical protein